MDPVLTCQLTSLSNELLCHIIQYLPLREALSVTMLCKKLSQAVDMHFHLCKFLDFSQGQLFGYMPLSITDEHLHILFKKCPRVEVVYGLHPVKVERRRLRKRSALTVPGIVEALGLCSSLKAVETCDLRLLEAILQMLPHLEIIGHFRNRDGTFPPHASRRIKLQPFPRITSLHLIGVEVPELTEMLHVHHLHLHCVRFIKNQPFRSFAAQNLETFVMKHCLGPTMSIRYLPLIFALTSSPNLSRLELVRVPLPGGLVQRAVEENYKNNAFMKLKTLVVGGCKGILEPDIGHLVIVASENLETLCIQPSLTKDSLFVALSFAQCHFSKLQNLHLGYVDKFHAIGDYSNVVLHDVGLAELPDTPSSLTDSGMKVIGQLFPNIKNMCISNCPHLMTASIWVQRGVPSWEELTDLTLQRCHCLQMASFTILLDILPKIQTVVLEDIFQEPPKGCSHVGLSAGTGLGMSSAVVSNQDEHIAIQGQAHDLEPRMDDHLFENEDNDFADEGGNYRDPDEEPHIMVLQQDMFDEQDDPYVNHPQEDRSSEVCNDQLCALCRNNPRHPSNGEMGFYCECPLCHKEDRKPHACVVRHQQEESTTQDDAQRILFLQPSFISEEHVCGVYKRTISKRSTRASRPSSSVYGFFCFDAAGKKDDHPKNKFFKEYEKEKQSESDDSSDSEVECLSGLSPLFKKAKNTLQVYRGSVKLEGHKSDKGKKIAKKRRKKSFNPDLPSTSKAGYDVSSDSDDACDEAVCVQCIDEYKIISATEAEELTNIDVSLRKMASFRSSCFKISKEASKCACCGHTIRVHPLNSCEAYSPLASEQNYKGPLTRQRRKMFQNDSYCVACQNFKCPKKAKPLTTCICLYTPRSVDRAVMRSRTLPLEKSKMNSETCFYEIYLASRQGKEDFVPNGMDRPAINFDVTLGTAAVPSLKRKHIKSEEQSPGCSGQHLRHFVSQGTQATSYDIRRSLKQKNGDVCEQPPRTKFCAVSKQISTKENFAKNYPKCHHELVNKATSTSDPLLEDDAIQVLHLASDTLESLTIISCGVSHIFFDRCNMLSHVEVQACRILKQINLNLGGLTRVNVSQCPKQCTNNLISEALAHVASNNLLVYLEPCMKNHDYIDIEKMIFSQANLGISIVIFHDFMYDAREEVQAVCRENLYGWLEFFQTMCNSPSAQRRPRKQKKIKSELIRWECTYPYGQNVRRLRGQMEGNSCYEVVTNSPLFVAALEQVGFENGFPSPPSCDDVSNFVLPLACEFTEAISKHDRLRGFYIVEGQRN